MILFFIFLNLSVLLNYMQGIERWNVITSLTSNETDGLAIKFFVFARPCIVVAPLIVT